MNRRNFVKNVSIVGASAITSTFFSGCAGAKVAAPIVKKSAKTVGIWFAEYLFNLALDKSFDSISQYISRLDEPAAQHVNKVNDGMREDGFEQFAGKQVFQGNGVYTYEVGHRDNFNSCAPFFFNGQKTTPLVEGPTVIGLAKAAEDYRKNGRTSNEASLALLPQDEFQRPRQGNAFRQTFSQPYVALTSSGSVIVDYSHAGSEEGLVEVVVADLNGERRFQGSYQVIFS
ncbi:MAG: hypothetical protein AAF985_26810 [Bacteroidota bacterium]